MPSSLMQALDPHKTCCVKRFFFLCLCALNRDAFLSSACNFTGCAPCVLFQHKIDKRRFQEKAGAKKIPPDFKIVIHPDLVKQILSSLGQRKLDFRTKKVPGWSQKDNAINLETCWLCASRKFRTSFSSPSRLLYISAPHLAAITCMDSDKCANPVIPSAQIYTIHVACQVEQTWVFTKVLSFCFGNFQLFFVET